MTTRPANVLNPQDRLIHRFPPVDLPKDWIFAVDSNEAAINHKAYDMKARRKNDTPLPYEVRNLFVGDYSVIDPQGLLRDREVVVERKSYENIVSDVTNAENRRRLEAAFERMTTVPWAAVVIEADWDRMRRPPRATWRGDNQVRRRSAHPNAIQGTCLKWAHRYRVPIWLVGSRFEGERVTRWILAHFALEQIEKGQ